MEMHVSKIQQMVAKFSCPVWSGLVCLSDEDHQTGLVGVVLAKMIRFSEPATRLERVAAEAKQASSDGVRSASWT